MTLSIWWVHKLSMAKSHETGKTEKKICQCSSVLNRWSFRKSRGRVPGFQGSRVRFQGSRPWIFCRSQCRFREPHGKDIYARLLGEFDLVNVSIEFDHPFQARLMGRKLGTGWDKCNYKSFVEWEPLIPIPKSRGRFTRFLIVIPPLKLT